MFAKPRSLEKERAIMQAFYCLQFIYPFSRQLQTIHPNRKYMWKLVHISNYSNDPCSPILPNFACYMYSQTWTSPFRKQEVEVDFTQKSLGHWRVTWSKQIFILVFVGKKNKVNLFEDYLFLYKSLSLFNKHFIKRTNTYNSFVYLC